MATDPASAFLRGFTMMDQLETNRQRRAFAEEQMSRTRKMWQREDDEYEQFKLNRYREEKAIEFAAITDGILQDKTVLIDQAEAAGDMKTANELRDKWFLGPNAKANLINEAWHQQISNDPEFGEHLAISFDQDPAVGPFIRDTKRPVSGAGVVPPGHPKEGHVFFTVDAVTGKFQPLTEGRSARGNDPVYFGKPGVAELVKVYGKHANSGQFAIFDVLRAELDPPSMQGKPTAARENNGETTAEAGVTPSIGTPTTGDNPGAPVKELPESVTKFHGKTEEEERQERQERLRAEEAPPQNAITEEIEAAKKRYEEHARIRDEYGGFSAFENKQRDKVGLQLDISRGVLKGMVRNFKGMGETALGSVSSYTTFLFGDKPGSKTAGAPPRNTKDLIEANNNGAGPPVADLAASAPNKDQVRQVAGPASAPTATDIAAQLLQAQGTYTRPPPEEVYKAYMMAKAGMMTMPDVYRFKTTGQLGPQAKRQFHAMGEQSYVITQDGIPIFQGSLAGFGNSADTVAARKAVRQEIEAQIEGHYTDYKGNVDHRRRDRFKDVLEETFGVMGIGQHDVRRTDDRFINSMLRGSMFLEQFDEDAIQWGDNRWDFTFGDFKPPYTAGNVAIAGILADSGIVDFPNAFHGLRTYIRDFVPWAKAQGKSDTEVLNIIQNFEPEVQTAYYKFLNDGIYSMPSGKIYKRRMWPNARHELADVRNNFFQDLVENNIQGP